MASLRQIAANRANSRKSTGPKTLAGKNKVSANPVQHGVQSGRLLPGEDPAEFARVRQSYVDLYLPATPTEHFLIDRIVIAAWRLNRLAAMEVRVLAAQHQAAEERTALNSQILRLVGQVFLGNKAEQTGIAASQNDPHGESSDESMADRKTLSVQQVQEPQSDHVASAYIRDSQNGNTVFKFARYQTALERSYYRALHELLNLRAQAKD